MLGRTPGNIVAVRPLRQGEVLLIRKDFLEAGIEIRPRNIHFILIHIHRLRGLKLPQR